MPWPDKVSNILKCEGLCSQKLPLSNFSKTQLSLRGDRWCKSCISIRSAKEPHEQPALVADHVTLGSDDEGVSDAASNVSTITSITPSKEYTIFALRTRVGDPETGFPSDYVPPHLRGSNGGPYHSPARIREVLARREEALGVLTLSVGADSIDSKAILPQEVTAVSTDDAIASKASQAVKPISTNQTHAPTISPPSNIQPVLLPTSLHPADSYGARLMAAMGHIEGQGLGKDGTGRTDIIDIHHRPKGVGLGVVREKSVQQKAEEKRQTGFRGEIYEDSVIGSDYYCISTMQTSMNKHRTLDRPPPANANWVKSHGDRLCGKPEKSPFRSRNQDGW